MRERTRRSAACVGPSTVQALPVDWVPLGHPLGPDSVVTIDFAQCLRACRFTYQCERCHLLGIYWNTRNTCSAFVVYFSFSASVIFFIVVINIVFIPNMSPEVQTSES